MNCTYTHYYSILSRFCTLIYRAFEPMHKPSIVAQQQLLSQSRWDCRWEIAVAIPIEMAAPTYTLNEPNFMYLGNVQITQSQVQVITDAACTCPN